jgi:hypothetical protein
MKTYTVIFNLYDNKDHSSYGSNNQIRTTIQANGYQQVLQMIEAQYNGCAGNIMVTEAR